MPNNNESINEPQKSISKKKEIFSAKSKESNILKANPNPNFIPPATNLNKKEGEK